VREETNRAVCELVNHPFDISPGLATDTPRNEPVTPAPARGTSSSGRERGPAPPDVPDVPTDVGTSALMEMDSGQARNDKGKKDGEVQTAAWMQVEPGRVATPGKLDLNIPPRLPGSEAPRIDIPTDTTDPERERQIARLYPELPPLPAEPQVLLGPEGRPYTLADFQRLAAANSPALRQAASDVEGAKGNVIQAKTYPNPTFGYLVDPTNNNSIAGVQGAFIDQVIRTGGKQKLGAAAAQKDLDSALLAFKRARSDLSTSVRNAYFTVLVDVETLIVTRALARFTDDIYRLQTGLLKGAQAAAYEPASLRAQAFTTRLAYRQAIASYIYDWKALVATVGVPQLPISEIAGRVDRFIPYYDYDEVLAYTLQNHTDVLTARNTLRKAQYVLKLNQVTPLFPDLDAHATLERDFTLAPFGTYNAFSLSLPIPVWDQNKGNIIAAQAALVRAGEESHRVEVTLTNNLAAAYSGYMNNLYALEYYRRYILPDLVRYYRGIYARRQVDATSPFGDLVAAQQFLSSSVTSYIGVLGSLWTSVVSVADFLQTDDLFQLAKRRDLPEAPDFRQLPQWVCDHPGLEAACAGAGSGPCVQPPSVSVPLALPSIGAPAPPAQGAPAAPLDAAPPPPSSAPMPAEAQPAPNRAGTNDAGTVTPTASLLLPPPIDGRVPQASGSATAPGDSAPPRSLLRIFDPSTWQRPVDSADEVRMAPPIERWRLHPPPGSVPAQSNASERPVSTEGGNRAAPPPPPQGAQSADGVPSEKGAAPAQAPLGPTPSPVSLLNLQAVPDNGQVMPAN
jgi:cobalt-zinc-cadmium efflux system outer membrane protein